MRKVSFLCVFIVLVRFAANGQTLDKTIEILNQALDQAVVEQNFEFLSKHYADDFVFTHGTGLIDSKISWLENIKTSPDKFKSRVHDSTIVESHGDVAILIGRLEVKKMKGDQYTIKYIRVYALRNNTWQLLSHRTLQEKHL
jgi:ketosteroid isomerase-like protein